MAGITLKIAQKHLNAWLEAELAVTTNQSYTIGSRSLTRADLSDIREQIVCWESAAGGTALFALCHAICKEGAG